MRLHTQKEAEAKPAIAEANKFAQLQELQEAEAILAKGQAEAQAIRAKLAAEAEGLDKKAEAMKKYGEAAITEMLVKAIPDIAKAVATPLSNFLTLILSPCMVKVIHLRWSLTS